MEEEVKDEGEEIVAEISVFVTKQLSDNLYIFQYPLRSYDNPYPTEGRVLYKVRKTKINNK